MAATADETWDPFWRRIEQLQRALSQSRTININKLTIRSAAKEAVQYCFRQARQGLADLGFGSENLQELDATMQELLRLSNGLNPKRSYVGVMRRLRPIRAGIEPRREMALGAKDSVQQHPRLASGRVEEMILQTLNQLLPSAAISYQQALRDLADPTRKSLRGTAVELRETLREVLDHLAPDAEVMRSAGFQLEKAQTRPTMKQKVRFILRSRGLPSGALDAPQDATSLVEQLTASLARSAYDRSSIATHVVTSRREVQQIKLYVDSVLSELLQVHS